MSYVPIRLSTLRAQYPYDFDIYINLKSRYVLYIKNGDDIQRDRLSKLKEKKVRQLFINGEDEVKYQAFLDNSLKEISCDKTVSNEEKADMVQGVASSAVEDLHEDYQSIKVFKNTEKAIEGMIDIIQNNPKILGDLYRKVLASESDPIVKHSVSVAFLNVKLAEMYSFDQAKVHDLGVAGMMHDLAWIKMSEEHQKLFFRPYGDFTQQEWKVYTKHPSLAVEMLQDKEHINSSILALISTHEEKSSGEGFPEGLQRLSVEQEIMSLTCCYDRMVTMLNITHKDALQDIQVNQLGNYDLGLLSKFKELLKAQGIFNK